MSNPNLGGKEGSRFFLNDGPNPRPAFRNRIDSRQRRTTTMDRQKPRAAPSVIESRRFSVETKAAQPSRGIKGTLGRLFSKGDALAFTKWITFSETDPDDFLWEKPYHYFFTLLACTISVSDLVKFPERCIKYGGVWFIAIHLLFTFVFAFPFFVVENLLGQFSGAATMQVINVVCPILGGFGVAIMATRMIELVEFSAWLCWAWLYLFASFTPKLPWSICGHEWNNRSCFTQEQQNNCSEMHKIYWNLTCTLPDKFCTSYSFTKALNSTHCIGDSVVLSMSQIEPRVDSEHQFLLYVTENPIKFESVSDAYILITYTICWLLYYLCIRNGMKSTVHMTYLTLTYTFFALSVFIITTLFPAGSWSGIEKYMLQNIDALAQGKAWLEALRSSLDTLSLGFAINFIHGKFNDYSYNFMRPLSLVVLVDVSFCVLFSFTVAAFLGMAEERDPNLHLLTDGIPLLLHSFPRIFQYLSYSHVFCVIFYLFCISVSLEIGCVFLETILISVINVVPRVKNHKHWSRMSLCFCQWCIGIFFLTEPGLHIIKSVKRCNALDSDFLFAIEAILITWVYGFGSPIKGKHFHDFKDMLGYLPRQKLYLQIGFYITAPVCSLVYTCSRFVSFEVPQETEWWARIIYILLLARSPFILLIFAGLKIREYRIKQKPIRYLFLPEEILVAEY